VRRPLRRFWYRRWFRFFEIVFIGREWIYHRGRRRDWNQRLEAR
jgi:hypothetical protein